MAYYWVAKAIAQGIISLLPKNYFWNCLFQHYLTKSLDLFSGGSAFEDKLAQCKKHLDNYFRYCSLTSKTSFSVMEIGTGWHPIVPVGLYLCGASKIWTIDIRPWLSPERVKKILSLFVDYNNRGILANNLPLVSKQRIDRLKQLMADECASPAVEILKKLNIWAVRGEARDIRGLGPHQIDLFVSNNTLEHIHKEALYDTFTEIRRIASPQAVMSHFIDMGDHYATFDHSISPYNFLKYSKGLWRVFNNPLHYQNRLRISDYRKIHQATGWKILNEQHNQGSSKELKSIALAKEFQHYPEDELLTLSSWIVAINSGQPRK